jgi:hypothetical protein
MLVSISLYQYTLIETYDVYTMIYYIHMYIDFIGKFTIYMIERYIM